MTLYFNLIILTSQLSTNLCSSYWHHLAKCMEELFKVDNTISFSFLLAHCIHWRKRFWRWESSLAHQFHKSVPASLASASPFPTALIPFDSDPHLFVPNCAVLLDGIGAHISHTRPLQKADIAMASWIFGTHGNTCPVFLLQVLQKVPSSLYLLAAPPPLASGLKQSGVVPKSWCHLPGSASLVAKTHPVRVCGRTERLGSAALAEDAGGPWGVLSIVLVISLAIVVLVSWDVKSEQDRLAKDRPSCDPTSSCSSVIDESVEWWTIWVGGIA